MWYTMEQTQERYRLSDRLIRAISNWQFGTDSDDDIDAILEAGADVNGKHGTLLPLHCACMVSDSNILKLLLQRGAEVNAADGYGRAALHYAAERDVFCVGILFQNGADINQGDGCQDTPLHWAAFKNNIACVKLLCQLGADVNATDFNHDTPLIWAARKGHLEVITILLEYNADVDIRNFNGVTALQRSAQVQVAGLNNSQDDASLDLLIRASGQFDLRDEDGDLHSDIARDNRLSEYLRPYCENPRCLIDLTRRVIRRSLGPCYLPNTVRKLPIPKKLQDFLMLQR